MYTGSLLARLSPSIFNSIPLLLMNIFACHRNPPFGCGERPFADNGIIHVRDLAYPLHPSEPAFLSSALQSGAEHSRVLISPVFDDVLMDLIMAWCQKRRMPLADAQEIDKEYTPDQGIPNPDEGLRVGFNACLVVVHVDLMHLRSRVQHSHKPGFVHGLTVLHVPSHAGNESTVRSLLSTIPSFQHQINDRDSRGGTALITACRYRHNKGVKIVFD